MKINVAGMKNAIKPHVYCVCLWEEPDKRERSRGDLGLNCPTLSIFTVSDK